MPDDLHEKVKAMAEEYGMSVTAFINMKMKSAVEEGSIEAIEKRVSELEKEVFKKLESEPLKQQQGRKP